MGLVGDEAHPASPADSVSSFGSERTGRAHDVGHSKLWARASSAGDTDGPTMQFKTKQEMAILYRHLAEAHKKLLLKDDLYIFRDPVTDDVAPQYSEIIEFPMDFGTMKSKLDRKVYKNVEEYQADFRLICDNCMEYNGEESDFGRIAKKLYAAGFAQKNSILAKCRRGVIKDMKALEKEKNKAAAAKVASNKRPRPSSALDGPASKHKKTGALRAVVVTVQRTAEEIEHSERMAATTLAHAQKKAREARERVKTRGGGVIGCIQQDGSHLVFNPLAEQSGKERIAQKMIDNGPHLKARPVFAFLQKHGQYSYTIERSVAWDGGKHLPNSTDDEHAVMIKSLGLPYFDNEVKDYVESLQRIIAGLGADTPARKKVTEIIDHITLRSLTSNPEMIDLPEPKQDKKEKEILPRDLRERKIYFETMRDSVPVIEYLNQQLKKRLDANQTLIPGEEVEIARSLVSTLIAMQKLVPEDE